MNSIRVLVAIVVTFIWAASWIAAILTRDYQGIGLITPVMLLVAGYLFAREALSAYKENKNGSS
jgi:hypothetical protein